MEEYRKMKSDQQKQLTSWRPRGFIQWLLTILAVISFPFIGVISYYIWNPTDFSNSMSKVAMLMLVSPMSLLILTVFIIVLLIIAVWKRALIARVLLIPALLLLILVNIVPTIKMLNYAKSENVSVSLSNHFFGKTKITSKFTKDVVYGKTTNGIELQLDVWPAHKSSKTALNPAIVRIHGGGWVSGDKGDIPQWNEKLNELGYTVFDVQYRLPPHAGWKDEIGDVKSAIGWVFEHADTYKIDPEKINLMGQSAGGNLALLAGYSMGDTKLSPSTNVPSVPINSVINMYGPADMTEGYNNNPSPDYVQTVMKKYIGGTPSEFPDRYKKLSPISYINENTPPTITITGESDRIVPTEQGEILDRKLQENNVSHELYVLPSTDHAFDMFSTNLSTQFSFEKVKDFLQKYNK